MVVFLLVVQIAIVNVWEVVNGPVSMNVAVLVLMIVKEHVKEYVRGDVITTVTTDAVEIVKVLVMGGVWEIVKVVAVIHVVGAVQLHVLVAHNNYWESQNKMGKPKTIESRQ